MGKLERIEQFFNIDLEVKKILNDLVPNEMDAYDSSYIMKYSERLFQELKLLKYYIVRIMNSFDIKEADFINQIFTNYEVELANAGTDFNKLTQFYKNNLSDMSSELIEKINKDCKGYAFIGTELFSESKTVNEILHFLHHYITNNEQFYQDVPLIAEKNGIFLRGKETSISKEIYDKISYDMYIGPTDIISLSNKLLLMVRDKGHALTIEITKEENDYTVRYFIPKLCNYIMVNNLKGVTKVAPGDLFTVGLFASSHEELSNDIVNLIEGVPMDNHMMIEGGTCYNPSYSGRSL